MTKRMKQLRYIALILTWLVLVPLQAEQWTSYFAYNNVTRIAISLDKVYAISDGSLFSVTKRTERIQIYNRESGLHGTGITCIYYDQGTRQLIIGYNTGKIDLLSDKGVRYVGELYNKDMTQRKTINNVTVQGYTAYLSTAFGIQTMDTRTGRLVDSYWLRPGGKETDVQDVVISKDSIYAFTTDSLFSAALGANLVDYTYWRREQRNGRISPDADKGVHYADLIDQWYAGNAEGIIRVNAQGKTSYKPQGPLSNRAYRIRTSGHKAGIVQGGYSSIFFYRPGIVMTLENDEWRNYNTDYMAGHTGVNGTDFCDIAFDPADPSRFFVASFGYGLMEFRNNEFYRHHNHTNSGVELIAGDGYPYAWVDALRFDAEGNLWMSNISSHSVKVLLKDGEWVKFSNAACSQINRAQDLLISRLNPHIKIISAFMEHSIGVMDDNGTVADQSDDRAVRYDKFIDEAGQEFMPDAYFRTIHQTADGALLIGTENGLYRIPDPAAMLEGDRRCFAVHLALPDEGLTDIFSDVKVQAITEDTQGRLWIGTNLTGLFCVSADLTKVIYHFSVDNSPLPANDVMALAMQPETHRLFIGTGDGLILFHEDDGSGLQESRGTEEEDETSYGAMQQWKLHFSYREPAETAATPKAVFAVAGGSLFSVDRTDETIEYWNKSTGLSGSVVSHIAYDASSGRLVIAYADGRMDLLHDNGEVTQMPDLSMKAGSVASQINCLTAGTNRTYAGTPFGIMVLNTRKGEVSDTYYIGDEASAVDVQHIVCTDDSLFAFSYDLLYKAALKDNLVDYTFWQHEQLPFPQAQQAAVWHDRIYVLQNDSLLCRQDGQWTLAITDKPEWMHVSEGMMLLYISGKGVYRMAEEGTLTGITNAYRPNDGIYSRGEYWLAQNYIGLVRLGMKENTHFDGGGPNSNFGYFMTSAHGQIYSSVGGRWAVPYVRYGRINIYDKGSWRCIDEGNIGAAIGVPAVDICSIAVDPKDPGHFFAATFGRGLFEFKDYTAVKQYNRTNSPIREAAEGINPDYYTYTDGVTIDEQGNVWVLNATSVGQPIHVLTPDGIWHPLYERNNGINLVLTTPAGIWPDRRNSRYKWMLDQRGTQGMILLDDGGTPAYSGDDYCLKRESFVDQNGHTITPKEFRCWAQDRTNRIWLGTESGILTIPASVDFYTSDECQRIIIPRNDGTGLGDYLLGDEQINCMALDGGDRMWIGTANSGLYLIEDDTITVAHFTAENSLLPSNAIISITIEPVTGEVFVGTDNGIASYRSDASEPQKDMSGVYAYPNPVRPGYEGYISVTGLMENTVVNIVDAGGNLVCKTRSHGGTAVWDGRLPDGRKATPGVYTALCNANGGHTVVKILVIR